MKAVFVGDAHLKGRNDPNQTLFCLFLATLEDIDYLFIMGDLFEFWVGYNETIYNHYKPVVGGLVNFRKRGGNIIYTEGNHDFFLKQFFAGRVGADVYPETADIQFDGKRMLLAHGDLAERRGSSRFLRWFLRTSFFRLIHYIAPPPFSWRVAMKLSRKDRGTMGRGGAIARFMKEYAHKKIGDGFDLVVMGHTHIAAISHETVNGRRGIYANPGDWIEDHTYLLYENGELEIKRFDS
ncbi:MAG: UDP-2,3-diacylglucosamine diphosphatase [Deltaproteobacteria bacterium]|nr:UDP-2,3-diacylglucosamine diphosphatase [Deltaproteobacteria bacterium]